MEKPRNIPQTGDIGGRTADYIFNNCCHSQRAERRLTLPATRFQRSLPGDLYRPPLTGVAFFLAAFTVLLTAYSRVASASTARCGLRSCRQRVCPSGQLRA